MNIVFVVLTILAALGCGVMAGAFLTFSTFIMHGLGRLPAEHGMAAMQSINVSAVRPAFMTMLFAPAILSVVLTLHAFLNWGSASAVLLVAGSVLYLGGAVGMTAGYHVPLNNALAITDAGTPGSAAVWERYLRNWTRWNHLRAAASLAAAAVFTIALLV